MSKRKNRKISVIFPFGDKFYLEKKIKYEENYIDSFLIFDLVSPTINFKSELEFIKNITSKPYQLFEFEIDINSNWSYDNSKIFDFIYENLIHMDFDFDDILFFSKSNEFTDFEIFDDRDLITYEFLLLNHMKIFWNKNLTDSKFLEGTIIMKFSQLINKDFFLCTMDYTKIKYDTLDYINFKNGWVFFGLDDLEILKKQINYEYSKLNHGDLIIDEGNFLFLKENNFPIEINDYKKIRKLDLVDLPSRISCFFNDYNFETIKSRKIVIDFSDNSDSDSYENYVKVLPTKNILEHLSLMGKHFYVYLPNESFYSGMIENYLRNEYKKAIQIFSPSLEDLILIKTNDKDYQFTWGDIKEKIIFENL